MVIEKAYQVKRLCGLCIYVVYYSTTVVHIEHIVQYL